MIVIFTQCFPPAIGGIEHLVGGAARSLVARGRRVHVLADGKTAPLDGYGDVQYFSGFKPLRNLRKALALWRLSRKAEVEALLADSWKSLETLCRFGFAGRVGTIVCYAHGNEFPAKPSARKAARIRKSLSVASRIIANSQFTADRVRRYVDSSKIVVRAPAIDVIAAATPAEQEWAVQLWGGRHPRILSLARLEPLKGIDQVLMAVKTLLPEYPDLGYVIAGDGADLQRLKQLSREYGLGSHVVFAGAVHGSQKSALYFHADVFAMPTRRVGTREEAFGMVYLEAALHGVPVIGGLAGGAREAVVDGETGFLVDGDDIGAITHAIRELLEDGKRRETMSDAAACFARRFTWPAQVPLLERDLGLYSHQD